MQHICKICNRGFVKKASLTNHTLICNFRLKSTREQDAEMEENMNIPTYKELVKIVQDMSCKMIRMEKELEEWKKRGSLTEPKPKPKINYIEWLNTNRAIVLTGTSPSFLEWVKMELVVPGMFVEKLMDYSLTDTIQKVFEHNLPNNTISNILYPICGFIDKPNTLYVCNADKWRILLPEDMVMLVKSFQDKMIKELLKWKEEKEKKGLFDEDASMSAKFNKAIIKLMSIDFKQDHTMLGKIKTNLYQYLKEEFP